MQYRLRGAEQRVSLRLSRNTLYRVRKLGLLSSEQRGGITLHLYGNYILNTSILFQRTLQHIHYLFYLSRKVVFKKSFAGSRHCRSIEIPVGCNNCNVSLTENHSGEKHTKYGRD